MAKSKKCLSTAIQYTQSWNIPSVLNVRFLLYQESGTSEIAQPFADGYGINNQSMRVDLSMIGFDTDPGDEKIFDKLNTIREQISVDTGEDVHVIVFSPDKSKGDDIMKNTMRCYGPMGYVHLFSLTETTKRKGTSTAVIEGLIQHHPEISDFLKYEWISPHMNGAQLTLNYRNASSNYMVTNMKHTTIPYKLNDDVIKTTSSSNTYTENMSD